MSVSVSPHPLSSETKPTGGKSNLRSIIPSLAQYDGRLRRLLCLTEPSVASPWLHMLLFWQSEHRHKMMNEQLVRIVQPASCSLIKLDKTRRGILVHYKARNAYRTIRKQTWQTERLKEMEKSQQNETETEIVSEKENMAVLVSVSDPWSRFSSTKWINVIN